MQNQRVVVTGLGVISPIGNSPETYWENLTHAVSGVTRITSFDPSTYSVQIAAEVKGFDPEQYMDRKLARRSGRFVQFSIAASGQALANSGYQVTPENEYETGVIVATGGGGVMEIVKETEVFMTRGADRVSPLFVPSMISNMASCQVSINWGLKGPAITSIAACAAGIYSFFEALQFLRRGDVRAMLTGGTESAIIPLAIASLGRMGALSKRNDEPTRASRPFDRERDGFVFGEGAAILMLETLDSALQRNANILAEVAGASVTSDAYHVTAPEPAGESAALAMRRAIRDAGLAPDEIEYICAHGTGTPLNDASETRAIKKVFGDYAYQIPISSPKSMIGHLLGAAGAMSALTCVQAISRGCVPPTANLENPDPECDLDYVPRVCRNLRPRTAMANGFGFGGQNSVVVFKAFES